MHRGRRATVRAALAAVAVLLAVAPRSEAAGPITQSPVTPLDSEAPCLDLVPRAAEPVFGHARDPGDRITLSVAVLADGIPVERAQRIVANATKSYARLNIVLVASSMESVAFPTEATSPSGQPMTDVDDLLRESQAHFRQARPAGSDAVFTMTDKDLYSGNPDNSGVAGKALCIGGVRDDVHPFAVGEAVFPSFDGMPVGIDQGLASKVFAHELGHLMGAQHHYANCAQDIGREDLGEDVAPCTVMINDVDLEGRHFSTLEGAVIRGYASDYARP